MQNKYLPSSSITYFKTILYQLDYAKLFYIFLFCVLGQGLYIFLPGILGLLIDNIFTYNSWSAVWLALFPCIWVTSITFSSLAKFNVSSLIQDVRKVSKEIIFQHILFQPSPVYITKGSGLIENLMQELSFNSRYFFGECLPFFLRAFITFAVSAIVINYNASELIYIFIAWALVFIPISYFSAKKSIRHVKESLLCSSEVSAATVDVIENHELIPVFGTYCFEMNLFTQLLNKEKAACNRAQFNIDANDFFLRIIQVFLPMSITVYLITTNKLNIMTPGSLASIFSFTLVLANQIGDFGKGILSAVEVNERIKVALDKLRTSEFESLTQDNGSIIPKTWDIQFNNVHFNYNEGHTAAKSVNLEIKESEKIGIIGYSGAGKTTLTRLLKRSLLPSSGNIHIGGIDLTEINQNILIKNLAEVSQTIPLFHRSIRDNVAYGCPNISDNEIWEVLEKAQIANRVRELPDKLNTIIGVKGQKLSGGERARLGIARALLRNSKIIIFDEATASLDSESELLIQKALSELVKGKTLIAIAHRFSTLRMMDRIVVMDKGQIVGEGSHEQLLSENELYARLWTSQNLN